MRNVMELRSSAAVIHPCHLPRELRENRLW
jgi:hypothetical protein